MSVLVLMTIILHSQCQTQKSPTSPPNINSAGIVIVKTDLTTSASVTVPPREAVVTTTATTHSDRYSGYFPAKLRDDTGVKMLREVTITDCTFTLVVLLASVVALIAVLIVVVLALKED